MQNLQYDYERKNVSYWQIQETKPILCFKEANMPLSYL